jgi:5'-3' exonuclease
MGIKNLNRFLLDQCQKTSIKKTSLKQLRGKSIVIDTSIYMYKFSGQDALLENFYLMISLFRKHQIAPLFVFDGKPPPEKRALLQERHALKQQAEEKYAELQKEMQNIQSSTDPSGNISMVDAQKELALEMECLKKQFIRIRQKDTKSVKALIQAYGCTYYEAEGEADKVCAQMVICGKAWACLSDDMDMFVYGCPRVLRHISLLHSHVLLYDMELILQDLGWSEQLFKQIMVLSGTDYTPTNKQKAQTNLYETVKWSREYLKRCPDRSVDFYQWLVQHTKYIADYDEVIKIDEMFSISPEAFEYVEDITIDLSDRYDTLTLSAILQEEGFIFL